MDKKKYFDIWDEFVLYYPGIAEEVVDWYPSGRYDILIKLEDGSKLIFSSFGKTIRNVVRHDDDITEDEWRSDFGRMLKQKIRDAGITSEELSIRTGLSRYSISNYINGKGVPSTYNLTLIAKVLQCPLNELAEFD